MLSETVDGLPPELKREVLDFIEFLSQKYRAGAPREPMGFEWAGGLSELGGEITAVDLQHKASDWR